MYDEEGEREYSAKQRTSLAYLFSNFFFFWRPPNLVHCHSKREYLAERLFRSRDEPFHLRNVRLAGCIEDVLHETRPKVWVFPPKMTHFSLSLLNSYFLSITPSFCPIYAFFYDYVLSVILFLFPLRCSKNLFAPINNVFSFLSGS